MSETLSETVTLQRRGQGDMDAVREVVLQRLAQEPASFSDLVDEGLLDRSLAKSVRDYLVEKGLVVFWFTKPAKTKRGRPRSIYRLPR